MVPFESRSWFVNSRRGRLTIAEARLWNHLKDRSLWGRKFRRQHSVGPYVLDYYCPGERLAVELDGAAHDHEAAQDRDAVRTRFLQGAGIRLVRSRIVKSSKISKEF